MCVTSIPHTAPKIKDILSITVQGLTQKRKKEKKPIGIAYHQNNR